MDNTILSKYNNSDELCFSYDVGTCCGFYTKDFMSMNKYFENRIRLVLYGMTLCGYSIFDGKIKIVTLIYRTSNQYGHPVLREISFRETLFNKVIDMIRNSNEPIAKYNYIALLDLKEKVINNRMVGPVFAFME